MLIQLIFLEKKTNDEASVATPLELRGLLKGILLHCSYALSKCAPGGTLLGFAPTLTV